MVASASLGVTAGAAAGVIAWQTSGGNPLVCVASILLGAILALVPSLLWGTLTIKFNALKEQIDNDHTSIQELVNIRPLIEGPPLDYGHWAMGSHLGKVIAQVIARHEPSCIVECGSGTSTAFIAQVASRFASPCHLISLDHMEDYAARTRRLLKEHNCAGNAEVVTAPLRSWQMGDDEVQWYDVDLSRFPKGSIDLLVVDGPPAISNSRARYPAVPILEPFLSQRCVIIMDDTSRVGEKQIAKGWAEILNAEVEDAGGPKGAYILRRGLAEGSDEREDSNTHDRMKT
jgi:predicted O-methyltransferase YrrM